MRRHSVLLLMIAAVLVIGQAPLRSEVRAQTTTSGKAIAFDRAKGNCLACHAIKGGDIPSTVGPELSDIKARFPDRKELYQIIYDEERRNPQTVMPAFGKNLILTQQEINEVIDFLYKL